MPVTYLDLKSAPAEWAIQLGYCNEDKRGFMEFMEKYNEITKATQ